MQRSYPSQLKRDKTELQENLKFTTFLITLATLQYTFTNATVSG